MHDIGASRDSFSELADASHRVAAYYLESESQWVGSPFEWLVRLPSRRKGAAGERIIEDWAVSRGLAVSSSPSTHADRIINGHRVEIKLSTLWSAGVYKFQQIRDQDYDYCLCLGLSPFEAHVWLVPKDELLRHVIGQRGQHRGREGTDTSWITVEPESPEEWMRPYGDTLDHVHRLLSRESGSFFRN